MIHLLGQIVAVLGLVLICLAVAYFFGTMFSGIHWLHRQGSSLGEPARTQSYVQGLDRPGAVEQWSGGMRFYFIVPALDEAAVIGQTVRSLCAEASGARIVVVDDASSDGTAEIARAAGGAQVLVVRRRLPQARLGKGPALNAGFQAVVRDVRRRGLEPGQVVVVVVDADGRLSVGATRCVATLFAEDPGLGGVQLAVRIRNRERLLARMQDLEFWGLSALTQLGRSRLGAVGLGGNGQFCRLSALQSVGPRPWSTSLTEDLDLGISLLLRGWKLTTTPKASVEQEGVHTVRKLLRQRTRWLQGHMSCTRRIGEIWASPHLSTSACVELCLTLVLPWLFFILWSIVIHLLYLQLALRLASVGTSLYGNSLTSKVVYGASLFLFSFLPNLVMGFVYHRRDPEVGMMRGMAYGLLAAAVNYLNFVAGWRAFGRLLIGRTGWEKTERGGAPAEGPAFEPLEMGRLGAMACPSPARALVPSTEGPVAGGSLGVRHPVLPAAQGSRTTMGVETNRPGSGRARSNGAPVRQRSVSPRVGRHKAGRHRKR